MKFVILQERTYGQPKLTTPKVLKGHKQVGSATFNEHCKCPVHVIGNSVYIKMRDWFSPAFKCEESGTPLNYRLKKYFPNANLKPEKFIYHDNWGEIILRSEAWVVFHDVEIDSNLPARFARVMFRDLGLIWYERNDFCSWVRFFEDVCKIIDREIHIPQTNKYRYVFEVTPYE